MATEAVEYDYYPEKIAKIMMEHDLIHPIEEKDFTKFVRGC